MDDFILISRYAGMREDLVQAGGGNSSVKLDRERMLVKASGVQLADVTETEGYCVVDYRMVKDFMKELVMGTAKDSADEVLKKALLKGKRPSIETFLHAVTGKVTLHTHSLPANVLAASREGMGKLEQLFPEALFVGYATPGAGLAKEYYNAYLEKSGGREDAAYPLVFLENHGLVTSGDTAEDVIRLTDEVSIKIEEAVSLDCSAYRKAFEIFRTFEQSSLAKGKVVVKAENGKLLQSFRRSGYRMWGYQFCPDCIVYGGLKAFDYQGHTQAADIDAFARRYGEPAIITCGEELYIRADSVKKAREVESVLAFSGQVAGHASGGPDLLAENEQKFLLDWDVEKYRSRMK